MTEYELRTLLNYILELSAEVVVTAERGNAILLAINETIYQNKPIAIEKLHRIGVSVSKYLFWRNLISKIKNYKPVNSLNVSKGISQCSKSEYGNNGVKRGCFASLQILHAYYYIPFHTG